MLYCRSQNDASLAITRFLPYAIAKDSSTLKKWVLRMVIDRDTAGDKLYLYQIYVFEF